MSYQTLAPDLSRPGQGDHESFYHERDRYDDRGSAVRERFEEDDHVYSPRPEYIRVPVQPERRRERSVDERFFERERRFVDRDGDGRRPLKRFDDEGDEIVFWERDRRVVYDDEPNRRICPRGREEIERRVVIEQERVRSPSPFDRRPGILRRQSSLDTFDRFRGPRGFYQQEERGPHSRTVSRERVRDEVGDAYRATPHRKPIVPLPRHRALPPPRVHHGDREYYDEIQVLDSHYYGDEDMYANSSRDWRRRPPPPDIVHEREIIRERRHERSRSRDSATTTAKNSRDRRSRSTSTSSSSSMSSIDTRTTRTTARTVKSEYPKKGKTRIPARLVSKRAIIDLEYPFEEEPGGKNIILQKALGQDNIDDLLRLSEDYKKSELEIALTRSQPREVVEERKEDVVKEAADPAPQHVHTTIIESPPPPKPEVITIPPPAPAPPPREEAIKEEQMAIRDASPGPRHWSSSRSCSSSRSTSTSTSLSRYYHRHNHVHGPVIIKARPRNREVCKASKEIAVEPMALVEQGRHRSCSRHQRRLHYHADPWDVECVEHDVEDDIRSEIRHLERQLARRDWNRDLVRAERLSSGEVVLYEERLEKVEEPSRGVRIEKDKKGRMSISVPKKYR